MTDEPQLTADDLALSQLLDEQLPPAEAERLQRRLREEPALAARLAELRGVDLAARQAYSDVVDEPLPRAVLDLLEPRERVATRPSAAPAQATPWLSLPTVVSSALALAAGFVLAMLMLPSAGPQDPAGPPGLVAARGAVASGSALYETLQDAASAESRDLGEGWSATPSLSFVTGDNKPCRRVDLNRQTTGLATIACRRDGEWRIEVVEFARVEPGGTGFRTATGGAGGVIDLAIDGLIEGDPLDGNAEAAWIRKGWN